MADKKMNPWYSETDNKALIDNALLTVRGLVEQSADRLERWDINEIIMQETRYDHHIGRTNDLSPSYQRRGVYSVFDGRLRYNIIRSIGDALKARIASARPMVRLSTHNSRFAKRELARHNTKLLRGVFLASNFYDLSQQIFYDAFMYGVGYAKPYEVDGKIRIDRVHPRCVFMEEPDYGTPCSWFQVEDVSKWELKNMFPEYESEIDASSLVEGSDIGKNRKSALDRNEMNGDSHCTVIEAWHATITGKGRHVIITDNCVLVDEAWKSGRPGVVSFRFFEPAKGFIGLGYCDQLKEIQKEINYILVKVQDHMNLGGTLKIFLDGSSRVAVDKLNNEHLQIVKYAGTRGMPLQVVQIPAVDRIYFEQIDRLEQKAYNLPGIAEMFATSEKPAGLESGKALNTYEDIQSARFLHIGQKWQSFFNNVGIAILSMLEASGVTMEVGEVKLSGSDFSLGKNMFDVTPGVVSLLPDTPPGIIQAISDYAQMDPNIAADAIVLLEDLDLEAYLQRELAPKMVVEKIVDEMLYDHKRWSPDDTMNLEWAIKKATFASQQAILREDEKAKTILVDFIAEASALLNPPEQAAPMGQDMAMGAEMDQEMMESPAGAPMPAAGPIPELPPDGMPIPEMV